jgi:hypothetical protein
MKIRFILFCILLTLLTSSVITSYSVYANRQFFLKSFIDNSKQSSNQILEFVTRPLYTGDIHKIQDILNMSIKNGNFRYIGILDVNKHLVIDVHDNEPQCMVSLDIYDSKDWAIKESAILDSHFHLTKPIYKDDELIGYITITVTTNNLTYALKDKVNILLIVTVVIVGFTILVSVIVSDSFIAPLLQLSEYANEIKEGKRFTIDEVGEAETLDLSRSIKYMVEHLIQSESKLIELNETLDKQVKERTNELEDTLKIMHNSAVYASYIQHHIIGKQSDISALFNHSSITLKQKDIVGGDIYWFKKWGMGKLVVICDCTGHGIPGAFMTLVVNCALNNGMKNMAYNVERLLIYMHDYVNTILGADHADGFEIGICYINGDLMTYCGAGIPVFNIDTIYEIQCDQVQLGFNDSLLDKLKVKLVSVTKGDRFLMVSDGVVDQLNDKYRSFGKQKLCEFLYNKVSKIYNDKPEVETKDISGSLYRELMTFRGSMDVLDDITIVAFEI